MRDLTPGLQSLVFQSFPESPISRWVQCAFIVNGYGAVVDEEQSLSLLRDSASAGHPNARDYYYRLHKSCGSTDIEKYSLLQYLDSRARLGSRAALEDLEYAGLKEEAQKARTWLANRTGGVGARWYNDQEMLHGLVLGHWLDQDFLMSRAREVADISTYRINERGDTLLHLTAACGEHKSMKALVAELHHDINCKNFAGDTPLISACRAGQGGTVFLLVKVYDADASIAASNGETALHWLSRFDDKTIRPLCNDLIDRGAKVDAVTKERVTHSYTPGIIDCEFQVPGTPLGWAVHENRPDIVEVLLQHGADALWNHGAGLKWAAHYHHTECLRLMIESLETRFAEYQQTRQTHGEVADGDARHAVIYGELVYSAVHSADKFSMILRNGTQYLNRMHATLDLLREKTALVRISRIKLGSTSRTVFYLAVNEGHDEVVEYIIEKDWHANEINEPCDAAQRTPFLEAVRWNRAPLIELLVKNGADILAKACNPFKPEVRDWSALHIFAHEGFHELADLTLVGVLVALGIPVDGAPERDTDSLPSSVAWNATRSMQRLNLKEPNPDAGKRQSESEIFLTETPFSCALRNNSFKLCGELLCMGANPNALSRSAGLFASMYPVTILGHIIISNARYSSPRLRYLLSLSPWCWKSEEHFGDESSREVGAMPEVSFVIEPERDISALHRAAMGCDGVVTTDGHPIEWSEFDWQTNSEIIRELLDHVVSPARLNDTCKIKSRTPLHLAVCNVNIGAITALLGSGADKSILDSDGRTALELCETVELTSERQADVLIEIRQTLET